MNVPLVHIAGVTRRYGRAVVFEDVTLQAAPGEILGVVGPNGAGKTTLLRIVVGLIRPTRGHVRFERATGPRHHEPFRMVFFGGESTLPPGVRVRTWTSLLARGREATADSRRLGRLSRGGRQVVGLESALGSEEPALIVLDEPWEGLDPSASRWLSDTLLARRATGSAIIVSSHRLHDLAGVCDRYAFLANGRLYSYTAGQLAPGGTVSGELLVQALDRHMRPCAQPLGV